MKKLLRRIARLNIVQCFLCERQWFRKLHGGRWERWHVDFPVCSRLWMRLPEDATPEYREPLWRGTPEREVWQ